MRILHLGHKKVPSREGGIEIVVGELSTRMAKLGHHVTCYNRGGYSKAENQNMYHGVHLKEVPTFPQKGLAAMSSSISGAVCAAFGKYDIVHFHAEGTTLLCWLPRLLGKKVIVTIHSLDWKREKWGKGARAYIRLCEACAAKFANELIVLNISDQKYFLENYGRKVNYIPNGISVPRLREAKKISEEFGLEKQEYILYVGRLVPEKGLTCLIRAFREAKTEKKLVIAGGSSDTDRFVEELKNLAARDERVLFTGFVQGQVLEELYSNAYFYVLPSNLEGMPISLLEAMSYGNCCLVSDIPQCVQVVKEKAVIFKKGNVCNLRKKLQRLCDDEKIVSAYKKDVSQYVCETYSWDEVVADTLKLYEKMNEK